MYRFRCVLSFLFFLFVGCVKPNSENNGTNTDPDVGGNPFASHRLPESLGSLVSFGVSDAEAFTFCPVVSGQLHSCHIPNDLMADRYWAHMIPDTWGTVEQVGQEEVHPTLIDLDRDLDFDIVYSGIPSDAVAIYNRGGYYERDDLAFSPVPLSVDALAVDLDLDGFTDLAVLSQILSDGEVFDRDAWADVYTEMNDKGGVPTGVSLAIGVRVFRNEADGFVEKTREWGFGVAMIYGDDGPFNQPIGLTLEDYNADRTPDLIVRTDHEGINPVFVSLGGTSWGLRPHFLKISSTNTQFALHDVDGDGVRDEIYVKFNAGGNGDRDVIRFCKKGENELVRMECVPSGLAPMGFDLGDVNSDGEIDYYMSDFAGQEVCISDGMGGYTSAGKAMGVSVPLAPDGENMSVTWGVRILDIDADGDNDLTATSGWEFVTTRWAEQLIVFRNDGGGVLFPTYTRLSGDALDELVGERTIAVGDITGDGCPDFVLGPVQGGNPLYTSGVRVITNGLCEGRHMRFVPTVYKNNGPAVGVIVKVEYSSGLLTGFRSTNSGGLGGSDAAPGVWLAMDNVVSVVATFPTGTVVTYDHVPASIIEP